MDGAKGAAALGLCPATATIRGAAATTLARTTRAQPVVKLFVKLIAVHYDSAAFLLPSSIVSSDRVPIRVSAAFLQALRDDPRRAAAYPLLKDFYAAAIEHLAHLQERQSPVDFLAGPRQGEQLVVQLAPQQIEQVVRLAAAADVSQRRILYTALVLYARELGLPV